MDFKELEIQIENKYKVPTPQDSSYSEDYSEWLAKFKEDEADSVKELFRKDFIKCVNIIRKSRPSYNGFAYYGNLYVLKYRSSNKTAVKVSGNNDWDDRTCDLTHGLYDEIVTDSDLGIDNLRDATKDGVKDKLIKILLIPFINKHLDVQFDKKDIPKSIRHYYTIEDIDGKAPNPNKKACEGGFSVTNSRPDIFIKVMIVVMIILLVSALFGGAALNG